MANRAKYYRTNARFFKVGLINMIKLAVYGIYLCTHFTVLLLFGAHACADAHSK